MLFYFIIFYLNNDCYKIIMINIRNIIKVASIVLKNSNKLSNKKGLFKDVTQSQYFRPMVPVEDFFNKLGIDFRSGGSTFRVK